MALKHLSPNALVTPHQGFPRPEVDFGISLEFLGGGNMGTLMRAHRWDQTSLGPAETWPQSLRGTQHTERRSVRLQTQESACEVFGFLSKNAYAQADRVRRAKLED